MKPYVRCSIFLSLLAVTLLLFFPGQALAYESTLLRNQAGQVVFQYNYYTKGERFREGDLNQCGPSGNQPCSPFKRNLNAQERAALERGGYYWAEILSPGKSPAETLIYDIYPVEMYGAAAAAAEFIGFKDEDGKEYNYPAASAVLVKNATPVKGGDVQHHANAYIGINAYDFQLNRIQPQRPWNLEMVMIHEFGHSLGITSTNDDDDPSPTTPPTPFETYLKYNAGWSGDPLEPRWFFHGPEAMKVYGRPIPMEDEGHEQEKAHFGLRNTSMTHRIFRNYAGFVEVELASLVDIGYKIDLRNHFGRSIYTDNKTIVNDQGFFARNQAGAAYLPGMPNQSMYGIGLHIFGDHNTVYQAADLLADGPGAAGIRSDGVDTRLFINPNTRVTANGPRGTGLLVSYGSNSVVVHRGSIEARGEAGDAVRFDIGCNALDADYQSSPDGYGSLAQYSYLDVKNLLVPDPVVVDEFQRAEVWLNGPLVERFDVTGSISGSRNAIVIGGNSHVREINLMRGAAVLGRMVNDYYYYSSGRATALTFGRAAGADGQVIAGRNDSGFRYVISNDIIGWGAPINHGPMSGRGLFNLDFHAGQTTLLPSALVKVNQFTLRQDAALLVMTNLSSPNTIWSNDFGLAAGSHLGLSNGMQFGPELQQGSSYPVVYLNLNDHATGNIVSQNSFYNQTPLQVGIYDYASYDLAWSDVSAASRMLALTPTSSRQRNRNRAGDQATGAPLQMFMSDQSWQKVLSRPGLTWGADNDAEAAWHSRLWGGPYYSYNDFNGSNGLDDTTVKTSGVVLGYEGGHENFMAGLALSVAWPEAKSDGYQNQGQSWSVAGYFGFRLPLDLELGAALSYGATRFDQDRESAAFTYNATYNGQIMRTGLDLGRRFHLNESLSLRPAMLWEYAHIKLDDYSESGWGMQAQDRDSTSNSLWRNELSLELAWQPLATINFSGRLGWAHLYGDRHTDLNAHFIGDAANHFVSYGDPLNRDSMTVGLAAAFALSQSWSLRLDYQGDFGPESNSHGGEIVAVFEF